MDDLASRSTMMNLLAQAKFLVQGKSRPTTYQLLKDSLELNPKQPQTRAGGHDGLELGHLEAAIERWKALWLAMPQTPESQLLGRRHGACGSQAKEQGESADLSFITNRISLKVLLDVSGEVRKTLPADSVVFVSARATSGPPMPLAARKLLLSELPRRSMIFTDADAMMMPGMSLK